MQNKQVLVAGASGLIGSELALELAKSNTVYGLARFKDEPTRIRLQAAGVKLITKDIAKEPVDDIPNHFDVVFNQAVIYGTSVEAWEANVAFVGRLMQHCRKAKAFVQGSSGASYKLGYTMRTKLKETDEVGFGYTYGSTKAISEMVARQFAQEYNLPTVILRYLWPSSATNFQAPENFIRDTVKQVLAGKTIVVYQDQLHQTLVMSDAVRITIAAAAHAAVPPLILNVHSQPRPYMELIHAIEKVFGRKATIETRDEPCKWPQLDLSRLEKLIGLPGASLEEHLVEMKAGFAARGML